MSAKFRIGDKIRVIQDFDCWLDQGSDLNQIFEVVEENDSGHVFCPVTNTCDLDCVNDWPGDFEIVNTRFSVDLAPEAAVGYATGGLVSPDRQVVIDPCAFKIGTTLTSDGCLAVNGLGVGIGVMDSPNFTTLPYRPFEGAVGIPPQEVVTLPLPIKPELGVYRPNLEDRKVGKVRVELVDDGFPLALREIAKVMTWAQTAKGYKDHDWLNLPNPEQALSAAASRHRTDAIIQRQVGKSAAIECTDHESNILHKAHEAFGVLAQLELILRGVIK